MLRSRHSWLRVLESIPLRRNVNGGVVMLSRGIVIRYTQGAMAGGASGELAEREETGGKRGIRKW